MIVKTQWAEAPGPASVTGRPVRTRLASFATVPEEIGFLRRMVHAYRMTSAVREQAVRILTDYSARQKDHLSEATAIGSWVQNNIRYVNELPETFQTPVRTLQLQAGDCDDQTVLIASLCESVGIPCHLVAMKITGAAYGSGTWAHIFPRAVIAKVGGRKVPPYLVALDSTLDVPVMQHADPVKMAERAGNRVEVYVG